MDHPTPAGPTAPARAPELLTAPEVGELLRVSPTWLYIATKKGRIPYLRIGGPRGPVRFERAALGAYLDERHVGPQPARAPAPGGGGAMSASWEPTVVEEDSLQLLTRSEAALTVARNQPWPLQVGVTAQSGIAVPLPVGITTRRRVRKPVPGAAWGPTKQVGLPINVL